MASVKLSEDNFKTEVMEQGGKVLVDFYANWCGPCQMLAPIIEDISNEVANVKICKLNVDEAPKLAIEFNVMTIPSLILFENGQVSKRNVGVISKNEIIAFIGE